MIFKDRKEAGTLLAFKLQKYKDTNDTIVLGLPRGGVVVAYEIAKELHLPLDVIISRKIKAPNNPELAIGAISQEGDIVLDKQLIERLQLSSLQIETAISDAQEEMKRRLNLYRENLTPLDLTNKTAILIDDGIATGATIKAAIKSCKSKGVKKIILAIPVAPLEIIKSLTKSNTEILCLKIEINFWAIGDFYEDFPQIEDAKVIEIINKFTQKQK